MANISVSWSEILLDGLARLRAHKRAQETVDEWFFIQEIFMEERETLRASGVDPASPAGSAELLCRVAGRIPLSIPDGTAAAGSQDCAFSPSYALINPSFKVEQFAGYCDPTAIYSDIGPTPENGLSQERIDRVRRYWETTPYVKRLRGIYEGTGPETAEVVYFAEPVTGHTIPDMRPFLQDGVLQMQKKALDSGTEYGGAMSRALEAALILAHRYRETASEKMASSRDPFERLRLQRLVETLHKVPALGASNLAEAVQSFAILWQAMVLEQSPNPYAFSVGNLDRVLEPYFRNGDTCREEAVALCRHLLSLFQVGRRCWAISQNVIAGGRDAAGNDMTVGMTGILLEAMRQSNDPQPALSVKVHSGTPEALWRSMGAFFFEPGHSTPSLFNDDMLFWILKGNGIAEEDLADYAIAGCQEPLIMGKSSVNTTNTWLNLAKILELVLNDGRSLVTGLVIGPSWKELGFNEASGAYNDLETAFFRMLDHFLPRMAATGNECTRVLGEEKPVPFTSSVMDGFSTFRDMRDPIKPGARYNGSGCLIHGLSVVADSLLAVGRALKSGIWSPGDIRSALAADFEGFEALKSFLESQEKYGNDVPEVDGIASRIVREVGARVNSLRNPGGSPFFADWSTPSTHLLYGYWVGATPDGRRARTMLGYGVDPLPQHTKAELPSRMLSYWKLPYSAMNGGYASHLGMDPSDSGQSGDAGEKGLWLREMVVEPLFGLKEEKNESPYYVYFNIDTAEHLKAVMKDPEKHAPSGVYIMRIHGTFVNFLDLSPAIQEDIIARLEAGRR